MKKITNPIAIFFMYVALTLFLLYSIFPFYWTALQSLKTVRDANARTPIFFFTPTFQHYSGLWLDAVPENAAEIGIGLSIVVIALVLAALFAERLPLSNGVIYAGVFFGFCIILWVIPRLVDTAEFYDYFVNSIIVTVGTVVVSLSIGCLAAYGLARYAGVLGVVILVAAMAFRALPRLAFILPYFWLGRITGLLDSYTLVIITLVAVNQPFTLWMLRSFFMDIPNSIEEAAMIDGCGRLAAFWRVIIPLMWPGIVSTGLFSMLLAYNEFMLVRILTQSKWTLPVAISQFTGAEQLGQLNTAAAAAVSATIPITIVILFFQKQLLSGLTAGAVKG
ncbi:MAG: carbohydrate ABC transporter permease [bacterium]|nr:carbohydrate ABC transporter permease [bacterium]